MTTADNYAADETDYQEDEAVYDSVDYAFQIIDSSKPADDNVLLLCGDKGLRDHVLNLLKANPYLG